MSEAPLANPCHEAFAHALWQGETQADAYRQVYGVGYSSNASRLASRADVRARVAAMGAPDPAIDDLVSIILDLNGISIFALQAEPPQIRAALKATMAKAKLLGFY